MMDNTPTENTKQNEQPAKSSFRTLADAYFEKHPAEKAAFDAMMKRISDGINANADQRHVCE